MVRSLMSPRPWWLAAALALASGCSKSTAVSIGTCNEHSIQCGVQLQREGDPPRELKCTPPDTKLPMGCDCVESGQSRRHVSLATSLPSDLREAERLARDNCGW
jgi:hypothetical protein